MVKRRRNAKTMALVELTINATARKNILENIVVTNDTVFRDFDFLYKVILLST